MLFRHQLNNSFKHLRSRFKENSDINLFFMFFYKLQWLQFILLIITMNYIIYCSFITTHSSQKSRACKLYFCVIFQFFFSFVTFSITWRSISIFVHDKLTSLIINLSGEWLPTSKDEWPELGSKETVSWLSGGGGHSIEKGLQWQHQLFFTWNICKNVVNQQSRVILYNFDALF